MPGSILKLRVYDHDFSGCELFVSIDSQKKCFYGKIQSNSKTIDFNRSRHLTASVDLSTNQQPSVNLFFSAKKPHAEFSASKNIYNILIKADSIESNIMESMSILMKSKSNKNVAEIFFTLIVNLSYFSPIRTFNYRTTDSRLKPSIFTPDTKFNPSKALSQELSKLSSAKRVKLNYQLNPKQDHKLFDTLTNQVFNETSSSDFDNGSSVPSSQIEMITEPSDQSNHSSGRKHQSSFNSNNFDYSSNTDSKSNNDNRKKVENDQNQNQNQQNNSIFNQYQYQDSNIEKFQAERINTPETKNSQNKLTDVGKHSVRKPVSWRKGKKPDYLKSDKENENETKLPTLNESRSNESFTVETIGNGNQKNEQNHSDQNDNEKDNSKGKVPELNKQNLSPIFDILNSPPHLSPRLPHLDHPKVTINAQQQQKTDNNNDVTDNINQFTDLDDDKKDKKDQEDSKSNDSLTKEEFESSKDNDDSKNKDSLTKEEFEISKDDDNSKSKDSLKKEEFEISKDDDDSKSKDSLKKEEKESSKDDDDSKNKDSLTKEEFESSKDNDDSKSKDSLKKEEKESSKGDDSVEAVLSDDFDDVNSESDKSNEQKSSKLSKSESVSSDIILDLDDKKDESDDKKDESDDKKDESDDKKDESDTKKDESDDKKDESDDKKDKSSESDDDDGDFF